MATVSINIRVTEKTRKKLRLLAAAFGCTLGQTIEKLVDENEDYKDLLRELTL